MLTNLIVQFQQQHPHHHQGEEREGYSKAEDDHDDNSSCYHTSSSSFSDLCDSMDFGVLDEEDDEEDDDNYRHACSHHAIQGALPPSGPQHERNKLYESLPSLEWSDAVDTIASQMDENGSCHCDITKSFFQKTFDRRHGQETKSQAFEQLHVLNHLSEERNIGRKKRDLYQGRGRASSFDESVVDGDIEKPCNEEQVINSRRSQLRRRIFKLQGDVQFDEMSTISEQFS